MDWRPLKFRPLFRSYLWGGRRLETLLEKSLPVAGPVAESWEVVDRDDAQSVVANGPLRGRTLRQALALHAEEILGRHAAATPFPLLYKFLDAQQNLSLQVHPNNSQAAQMAPPDLGKTEAWLIVHTEPGASIYCGLQPGCDRATLERALREGRVDRCLNRFEPSAGDCVFVPAGTPHAIGAGLVVAEIQQASDTTFRLYDWGRVDAEGRSRQLHIAEGLDVIDFSCGPTRPQTPQAGSREGTERLVSCDYFVLEQAKACREPLRWGEDRCCHLVSLLKGRGVWTWEGGELPVGRGETVLLPAVLSATFVPQEPSALLDAYLP